MAEGVFLEGQARALSKGAGRSTPRVLGHFIYTHMVWNVAAKFCVVIKLGEREIFYRVDCDPVPDQKFCDKCWRAVRLQLLTFLFPFSAVMWNMHTTCIYIFSHINWCGELLLVRAVCIFVENPWPPVVPHMREVKGSLVNVLLDASKKDYRFKCKSLDNPTNKSLHDSSVCTDINESSNSRLD